MKKLIEYIILIASAALMAASCDGGGNRGSREQVVSGELSVPDITDEWSYVSIEKGEVIGSCSLADTIAQQEWAKRTDWDIAICNGMIRTNSGASGIGSGGIISSETPFEEISSLRASTYFTDSY